MKINGNLAVQYSNEGKKVRVSVRGVSFKEQIYHLKLADIFFNKNRVSRWAFMPQPFSTNLHEIWFEFFQRHFIFEY